MLPFFKLVSSVLTRSVATKSIRKIVYKFKITFFTL